VFPYHHERRTARNPLLRKDEVGMNPFLLKCSSIRMLPSSSPTQLTKYTLPRHGPPDRLVGPFSPERLHKNRIGDRLAEGREPRHLHDEVDIGTPYDNDVLSMILRSCETIRVSRHDESQTDYERVNMTARYLETAGERR